MSLSDSVITGELGIMLKAWKSFSPLFSIFISSTEASPIQTDGHIDDSPDGYWLELLKCGTAELEMGSAALEVAPYTTRLRPVTDISQFSSYLEVFLTKAVFHAIDVTLTGNTAQDSAVLTAIANSITSVNDAYNQSRFRLTEIGGWQPDFFRPSLSVKGGTGVNVFQTLSSSNFDEKSNKGDLSIGRMLPMSYDAPLPVPLGKISESEDALSVYAAAGQIIEVSGVRKIQRYPILAELEFIGLKA